MNPDSLPNGGPAFPCDPFIASEPGHVIIAKRLAEGMSLRDYFAAKAMQRMLGQAGVFSDSVLPRNAKGWMYADCARCAYEMADAMLAARTQNPEAA